MDPRDILRHFDDWEARTRGLISSRTRVGVEPAFVPLFPRHRTRRPPIDDGRRPGFLERMRGARQETVLPEHERRSEQQELSEGPFERAEFELLLPRDFVAAAPSARAWLASLHTLREPLSVEYVGLPDRVSVVLACCPDDRRRVVESLKAHFPEAKLRELNNHLLDAWAVDGAQTAIVGMGLAERVFRQLASDDRLVPDPLTGLIGVLDQLAPDERGVVQLLVAPARSDWRTEFEQFVASIDDVDKVEALVRAKFANPLFAVVLRVAALAGDEAGAVELVTRLAAAVSATVRSEANALTPAGSDEGGVESELDDLLDRATHRSGMLLSLSEVLTLVHPPSASIRAERLRRQGSRTKAAPVSAYGKAMVLGLNEHLGDIRTVSLSTEERLRHTYVIGASGTGKSTLLLSMIAQDLEAGNGLAVLDPHGDLIDDVLTHIPADRVQDVIVFDPADESFPVGFNVLSAHSELERTLLSSDLVAVFKRLSTTFGDQMAAVLGNAVLAFLEHPSGGTLVDLRRFLIDKSFRAEFLEGVRDDQVVSYWQEEFPLLRGLPHAPLLTRLNTFLRPKLVRHMVAQRDDRLGMREIMDDRRILLARLSQGGIGEENAHLLGSLLVSRIAQAAMSRQEVAVASRVPFFLYMDEFHHFITPSTAAILSGARKYGLGLVLAHQELRQLRSRSEEVASAVLANAATRVVFRVSEQDAKTLADGLSFFDAKDLQNLGVGEAIVRLERPDRDFNLRVQPVPSMSAERAVATQNAVREASRRQYGRNKDEVEAVLRAGRSASTQPRERSERRVGKVSREKPSDGHRQPVSSLDSSNAPPLPGRGGPQHKYLQSLVKRLAEDRGFTATIEKRLFDGHGHVDVLLERGRLRLGCEISVTTSARQEADNLLKCLAAGFDYAVLISTNPSISGEVGELLGQPQSAMIRYITPDELLGFLDGLESDASSLAPSARKSPSSTSAGPQKLRTAEDTAARLGMAPQTLAKLRWSGDSPPFVKIGRRVFYDDSDVDAWIATRRRRSTTDPGPDRGRD